MSGDKVLCRLLFESAGDAILVLQDGRIVDCNASAEALFALPRQKLLDLDVAELWPSNQPAAQSGCQPVLEMLGAAGPGERHREECLLQSAAGKTFHAEIAFSAVEFDDKTFVQASIRDVSEVKQQLSFLRQVIDLNPHFIFAKDREGRFTLVNQAFADAYATSPDKMIGQADADFNPVDEMVEHYNQADMGVIESGQELFVPEEEITNIRGERLWRQTVKRPILDEDGETRQVLGVASDITDLKRAEQALAEREERLRTFLNALPDIAFILDEAGRYLEVFVSEDNPRYAGAVERLEGQTVHDIMPPEKAELFLSTIRQTIKDQTPQIIEYTFLEETVEFWFEGRVLPIRPGGTESNAVVWLARDITDRKQVEEELVAQRAFLGQIIDANPSHIYVKDWDGRFILVNKAFANHHGTEPEEMVGTRDADYVAEPEIEGARRDDREVMTSLEPGLVPAELKTGVDGQIHWFQTTKIPLISANGSSRQLLGVALDITDHKRLETRIRESLERRGRQVRLSSLVAQETVAVTSLDDLYQRVVTQVKEQFGFYHVQLLRHDVDSEALVLAAGYGEVGREMQAEGYRIAMGEGFLGMAAALGSPAFRTNLEEDQAWQPDARLPDARAEMVLPIQLGQQDAEAQITALKSFIHNEFDGFIVCVIDPETVSPVVEEALEKGIHVLTQNHNLGLGHQTAYVGSAEYETGFMLGLQAGEWAKQNLLPDEALRVGIFNHRTLPPVTRREDGIIDGLKAAYRGDFEIIENEIAPDPVLSMPIAARWLEIHPDINMILGINDGSALGAYQAVIAAGKNDPGRFFIGGIDATDESLSAIADGGAFQATVDKSPRIEALVAIRTLLAAITGQNYQEKNTVKTTPVNRSNLDEFFISRLAQNFDNGKTWADQDLTGLKIGLSVMTLNNPFFATFAQVVSDEAERLGIELVINDPKPVLGVLNVLTDSADALEAEDRLALEGLSGQIAVAIENTRLLEEATIFRQFADASGQGLSMATLDGQIVYMNRALADILQEDRPEAVVGHSIMRYYPRERQLAVTDEVIPVVLQQGQWIGQSVLRSTAGKLIPVIENYFLILDQNGSPLYLADVITDITEQKQAETELEARLQELSALQRLMTRDGWKNYQPSRHETTWGYMFDQTSLRPVTRRNIKNGDRQHQALPHTVAENGHSFVKPVAVHGEIIGQLGVYDDPEHPLDPEDQEFLDLIAGQVAEALERARLLEQTQQRAMELEAVAEVSTAASTALEVDKLLQQVVDLTKSRFSLYHAHIYLLNDTGSTLDLVSGAGDMGDKMIAQGWSIPFEHEHSLVARAARSQAGVIVNDVWSEPDFLPNPFLPDTRSEMAVPLVAGSRLLGVLDVQADVVDRFSSEDLQIQSTLAAQVAIALRNANLYTQIHEALTETEVLYDISAQINAAVTLDEALLGASAPAMATGANTAQLLTFEVDEDDRPEWAEVTANWVYEGTPRMQVGTRIYLPNLPFSKLWIDDPFTPVLISDVVDDERLSPALREGFLETDIRALVIMPLSLAGRWVGLITIHWDERHLFTQTDQRLYKSLATQSAVVVNNLLLYKDAQRRASQLEKLTQIEVALSQSIDEEEIIWAMAQIAESDLSVHIVLQYIDVDQFGTPRLVHTVASWRDGEVDRNDRTLGLSEEVDEAVGAQLWINASDTVQFFKDASRDPRLSEHNRRIAAQAGFKGLALLPLYSGGRWQGLATFSWPERHDFTTDERFVFQQMLEPMAAAVASRQAYLIQLEALAETEALYTASRRINEAGELNEIVAAVCETGPISAIERALLYTIEYDTMGQVLNLSLAAAWLRGEQPLAVPVGTSYSLTRYPHLRMLVGPDPISSDDIRQDERLSPEFVEMLQQLRIRAAVVLPLWAGPRQLGVLLLGTDEPYYFTVRELQPYVALARQMGVALENQRLLIETSQALGEAEAIQRRYTVQAWEKYRAPKRVLLYQQLRRGNTAWTDEFPEGLIQLEHANVGETQPEAGDGSNTAVTADQGQERSGGEQPDAEAVRSSLVVPLTVRGEVVGLLGLEETDEREWTPEERSLVQAISQQLAQAAENLRLIDETQQRAAREQRVNEIGEKIRAAQSLEEALQVAVKEVGLGLQTPETSVRLEVD